MARVITQNPVERIPGPFPPGRRCDQPGCTTILSTYHDSESCYACEARELGELIDLDGHRAVSKAA